MNEEFEKLFKQLFSQFPEQRKVNATIHLASALLSANGDLNDEDFEFIKATVKKLIPDDILAQAEEQPKVDQPGLEFPTSSEADSEIQQHETQFAGNDLPAPKYLDWRDDPDHPANNTGKAVSE